MVTIVFCRSPYHVDLIRNNLSRIEHPIIFLHLMPTKFLNSKSEIHVYIGEESKAISFSSIQTNCNYYKNIQSTLEQYAPCKIIIFNNYTPLTKMIIHYWSQRGAVELWEDGLNHYLNEHNGFFYYVKSIVKNFLGYYRKESFSIYSRKLTPVFDRFQQKNLEYNRMSVFNQESRAVFVGQPLIEDGFITKYHLLDGLMQVLNTFNIEELVYIPHPRESKTINMIQESNELKNKIKICDLRAEGFYSTEHYLNCVGTSLLISVFSTVNLNVSLPVENNIFIPSLFKLDNIKSKLEKLPFLNVSVL